MPSISLMRPVTRGGCDKYLPDLRTTIIVESSINPLVFENRRSKMVDQKLTKAVTQIEFSKTRP